VAPAYASPSRRVSQSLVPSPTPSRGRGRTHSSAPAGSAQSAPRSLRGRSCQCSVDSRIELAGELHMPLHQGLQACRSTDAAKNPPDAAAYGINCLQALAGRSSAVSARTAAPSVRPCRRPDQSSAHVEQSPQNVLRGKGFPAQLSITTNST